MIRGKMIPFLPLAIVVFLIDRILKYIFNLSMRIFGLIAKIAEILANPGRSIFLIIGLLAICASVYAFFMIIK